MKQFLINIALLTSILLGSISIGNSQIYPVQTNVVTIGPYLNYLSYFADQNNHLQITTTLTDFNAGTVQARLRIRIEGPGYTLYTNPTINVGQPLTLDPGVPVTLQGIDLLPYLQLSNLITEPSNLNINELPFGFTQVCVDVIRDGVNQEVLSTNNCTSFPLSDLTPPQVGYYDCDQVLDTGLIAYPMNWYAPTGIDAFIGQPGVEINYEYSLYNWYDQNNYSTLQSNAFLIYQTNVGFPPFLLNEFDIPGGLEVGEKYLWRVKAEILKDGQPINMIQNNGYSEWCSFNYGEPISLEDALMDGLYIDLEAEGNGERKGYAHWTVIDNTPNQGAGTFNQFYLEYRKKTDNGSAVWFSDTVAGVNEFIYQLAPETTYEVRISGMIGNALSDPSDIVEFTTDAAREYACGDQDLPVLPTNYTALENAFVGIEVQIGQFTMRTTELYPTGTPGHYSGKGNIPIDFLFGASAKVRFTDIFIDDQYNVREGVVEVMTDGVDNWLHDQYANFVDPIYHDGTVSGINVDTTTGSGWYLVDGVQVNFDFNPPDYPVIVNDENGYSYQIWPNGHIDTIPYFAIEENWNVGPNDVVTFSQNSGENAGFDGKEYVAWHANYDIMQLSDSSKYFAANKSLILNTSDQVDITLPSTSAVSFGYENGPSGPAISSISSSGTLTLPAFPTKGHYELFVYDGANKKIGKLNIHVYDQKQRDVVIVPLTNASIDQTAIQDYLDGTLGEAGLDISVTVAPQWNDSIFTPSTTIQLPTEVGLLTKYSDQMRQLRDAYFDDTTAVINNNAYYLFAVPGFDDQGELGYMVRGRGLGFVRAVQADLAHTIAHELGHGMGALKHSWKSEGPSQGSTNNLLDYPSQSPVGTAPAPNPPFNNLILAQWKELRDVDIAPSLFDDVEDAELLLINGDINDMLSEFANEDGSFTFISPAGKPITLKGQITTIKFATFEDRWYQNGLPIEDSYAPIGCLVSFAVDNVYFNAYKGSGSNSFVGYSDNSGHGYRDTLSRGISVNPLMVIPTYQSSGFMSTVFRLSNPPIFESGDTTHTGPIKQTWDLVKLIEGIDLNTKKILPSGFSTDFSLETLGLLNDLLFTNYASFDKSVYEFYGYEAITIYNAAYYIENIANARDCYSNFNEITKLLISEQLKDEYTSTQMKEQIEARNEQLLNNQSLGIYQDGTTPIPMVPPIESGIISFYTIDGQEEYQRRRLATALSGIRYYNQLISDFSTFSNLSDEDFDALVEFTNKLDKIPGLGNCLFLNINPESKVYLLKRITEWTRNDGKEEFLVRLLENTTDEQFALMYNDLFSDDCYLLHNLEGGFWYSHYDRFANRITQLILNYKNSNSVDYTTLPTMPLYHDGINPLDSEVECSFTDCSLDFEAQIVGYGNDVPGSFHPADLVRFVSEDNFEFPGYNGSILKIGDTLVAPAFWGYYFLREHDQHTDWEVFKYFAEAALIIATGGSAAPEIIQVELGILGADIVVESLKDEYPNNPGLETISTSLDALSIVIPLTGAHSIVKNGITRLPWISKIVSGTQTKFLFYKNEFNLFLRALKSEHVNLKELSETLTKIQDAVSNSNLVMGAKQTLLNYLTVAQLEIGMLKYATDPSKARLVVATNNVLVEIYKPLGNYPSGSKINIGLFQYNSSVDGNVFTNLVEYENVYGNVTEELTSFIGLQVLENGDVTTKSYKLVMTESGTLCLKIINQSVRHPNWIEITDISNKVEARLSHVDYLDFKGNGFHGCHTQNAMDQFLANNPGWTGGFVDGNGNAVSLIDNIPTEAYPWVKNTEGTLFTKSNGAQRTINGVQYGKASFFPKNWNTEKLKSEVEHAIANNHGLVSGNTYRGYSSDGSVEILFYYNASNGSIISFFPKVN